MSIVVYQDVATPIVPVEGLAGRIRDALGASLRQMRYITPDFAGLYQDAAGTLPVTAAGQPAGLMLDRRFGLARGAELVTSLASSISVSSGTGWVFSAGAWRLVGSVTNSEILRFQGLQIGAWYEATMVVSLLSGGGNISFRHPAPSFTPAAGIVAAGTQTIRFKAESPELYVRNSGAGQSITLSGLSIREIPGNHASQPTTTARPALRSSPLRIDYDGVDDYLRTVFPALGSNVTIARSIPGTGAQFLTGQTIATGNWDDNVDSCAVLVIDRALTPSEQTLVTAFLNQQAGV